MSDPSRKKKEAYERLALVIKALGGGLWEYDIDADRIIGNKRWYEILGLDEQTLPIRSIPEFRPHIHPDDVQHATEVDLKKVDELLAHDDIYHVDFRIIRPDGEIRWLRSVACLVRNSTTAHREAIGCVTDVTEFRQSEASPIALRPAGNSAPANVGPPEQKKTAHSLSPPLTRREKECLMWVSLGKTATESGVILGTSRRTVEFHLKNAVHKLSATNKIHATALAIRRGLI